MIQRTAAAKKQPIDVRGNIPSGIAVACDTTNQAKRFEQGVNGPLSSRQVERQPSRSAGHPVR